MIDKEAVKHVAFVSRIRLSEEEVELFSRQLSDVVEYFKILDELDVSSVEPSFHPLLTENVVREDVIGECLPRETTLGIACHKEGDYFKTPKVV